jgi:nucleotide-binding universal stress UspA family protein
MTSIRRIVVGVDGSEYSLRALRWAVSVPHAMFPAGMEDSSGWSSDRSVSMLRPTPPPRWS